MENDSRFLNVPCSCGGNNENCYKCGGWGYIDRISTGRQSQPASGSGSEGRHQDVARAVSVSTRSKFSDKHIRRCPLCKQLVDNLMEHLQKRHGTSTQRTQCEYCHALVRHMARHLKKAHPLKSPRPTSLEVPARSAVSHSSTPELVRCEHCPAMVRHMARHLRKVHRLTALSQSSVMPLDSANAGQSTDPRYGVRYGIDERVLDATRECSASYRDHGQFGSFPSYDNYDEESSA